MISFVCFRRYSVIGRSFSCHGATFRSQGFFEENPKRGLRTNYVVYDGDCELEIFFRNNA